MNLNKELSSISNISDYIKVTEKVLKCKDQNILLTLSIIHDLKKNRSLEIEFFNKYEGNGITFLVFDHLLNQPASHIALLAMDLISMVHYWLEAVRKHLIKHNPRWWSFLMNLLHFIQVLKFKDPTFTDKIVEQTVECLLDLACNSQMDDIQRYKVLQCVNMCSADSSRELRMQFANCLNTYFVTLATMLASCGHFPTQMSIMELLVRWLIPRDDPTVRGNAARAWFPMQLFSEETIRLFMEASWRDFYQSPSADECVWLDMNCATRSITIFLDLRDDRSNDCARLELLIVTEDNTQGIELISDSGTAILSVQTVAPIQLSFGDTEWLGDQCTNLRARIVGDPRPVDTALKKMFTDKYLGFIDSETGSSVNQIPEPVSGDPAPRRHRLGYAVRSRNPRPWNSPSTDSTTSLAQLRAKLTAWPPIPLNKVTRKVSITPDLPVVREVSEYEDLSSSKPRRWGVPVKYLSDSELKTKPKKKTRCIPPVIKEPCVFFTATLGTTDESVINDTFEAAYNSNTEFNLLDLLVEEARENSQEKNSGIVSCKKTQETDIIENTPIEDNVRHEKLSINRKVKSTDVSNIITVESDTDDVIEDTPYYVFNRRKTGQTSRSKKVTKSDIGDEIIILDDEIPCYVHDRSKIGQTSTSKNVTNSVIGDENITLDNEKFEEYFSQHVTEQTPGVPSVPGSPSVAEKINETTSESIYDIIALHATADDDDNVYNDGLDIVDLAFEEDIIDCVNSIIDKICDIENCAVLVNEQQHQIDSLRTSQRCEKVSINDINKTNHCVLLNYDTKKHTEDTNKVTLKFQHLKSRKRACKMNNKQKQGKNVKEPSNVEENDIITDNANSPVDNKGAASIRKKRKLYSPKDDDNDEEIPRAKTETKQLNICKSPMSIFYKELEKAHRTPTRVIRKNRASTEPLTSPKTKRLNDLFDEVKKNVINNEEITLVKKTRPSKDSAVFNLSSESDEEIFKKKKVQVQKRISSSSLESSATKRSRINKTVKPKTYCEYSSSSECERKKTKKSKRVNITKPKSRKVRIEPNINLIDEKMRVSTAEVLETSFIRPTSDQHACELGPTLIQAPVMEMLPGNVSDVEPYTIATENVIITPKKNQGKLKKEKGTSKKIKKHTKTLVAKKDKTLNKKDIDKDVPAEKDSATVSPLPGLVVETEQPRKDDINFSVEANLLQKFKNIYTEVQDLNETDRTQNMLAGDDLNDDAVLGPGDKLETSKDSEMRSVKSIATGGRSPITGHNDLNELPPNVKSLDETIKDRNLDIEEMNESLGDFLVNMRKQLNYSKPAAILEGKTSPILPITRMSTKERAMSITSNNSIPNVVLNRLPSEKIDTAGNQMAALKFVRSASNKCTRDVGAASLPSVEKERNTNPLVTPTSSSRSVKVVLSRMSPEDIEKYSSPTKSLNISSSQSVSVVLERISTDEIDKWLPIPQSKEDIRQKPKKYNLRTVSKPTGVTKRTTDKVVERTMKSIISPVKLNFGIADAEMTRGTNLRPYKTRSSTKSKQDEEIIIESQYVTDDKNAQKSINENYIGVISQESIPKSSADTTDILRKDKITAASVRSNVNLSENSNTLASVHEWFSKNAISPIRANNVIVKDVICKVMEMLDTTLGEIHQSTGEHLSRAFLGYQDDINRFKEVMLADINRFKEVILAYIEKFKEDMLDRNWELANKHKEVACEVLRSDAEKKVLMIKMLKEDMQAILDYIDKQNK